MIAPGATKSTRHRRTLLTATMLMLALTVAAAADAAADLGL